MVRLYDLGHTCSQSSHPTSEASLSVSALHPGPQEQGWCGPSQSVKAACGASTQCLPWPLISGPSNQEVLFGTNSEEFHHSLRIVAKRTLILGKRWGPERWKVEST